MLSDTNKSFKITKMKRQASFSMASTHYHSYYEIFYLTAGECNLFINHNIYKLTKGDLAIIPVGEIHRTIYSESQVNERYDISFFESDVRWLHESLGQEIFEECMHTEILSIPDKRRDYVEGLMSKMLYEMGMPDSLSYGFLKVYFIELMLFIMRCQKYELNTAKEIDVDNQLIQEIATHIYDNYDKNIYLDDIAARFNISRSYLSKKFKATTGFGFKEYLVNVRIKHACEMLLSSNDTITEIAFRCGFNDSNYFGDAFKHIKGLSPVKYRKNKGTI